MTPNVYKFMKLYRYAFFALAAFALGACSADVEDNDATFAITRVQSDRAWVDINPTKSNYYIFGAVPAADLRSSDRHFIDRNFDNVQALYDSLCAVFTESGLQAPPIEEVLYNSGSISEQMYLLEPNTEYIGYLYYLNKKKKPQNKLLKRAFRTPAKPVSDITFDVQPVPGTDDTYRIVPSNGDTYLNEEVSKSEVLRYFLSDTLLLSEYISCYLYYLNIVDTYYSNGFSVSAFTISGNDTTVLSNDYTLREGDVFYLACVGYTTEETTEPLLYRIDYHKGKPLTIILLNDSELPIAECLRSLNVRGLMHKAQWKIPSVSAERWKGYKELYRQLRLH